MSERAKGGSLVFLYQCHNMSPAVIRESRKLRQEVAHLGDTLLLYDVTNDRQSAVPNGDPCYRVSEESMSALGYPRIGASLVPGHAQFPLLQFYLDHPDFEHYWLVEYDVRFTGRWRMFFDSFDDVDADFLTCHIRRYEEEPKWCLWGLNHPLKAIEPAHRVRSFNTTYRLSNAALAFLHESLRDGWCGHHEVLMPTLLHHHGFRVMDLGGAGSFVRPGMVNKFYTSNKPHPRGPMHGGTMRFRPPHFIYGLRRNKLYHPVKTWNSFFIFAWKWLLRQFRRPPRNA